MTPIERVARAICRQRYASAYFPNEQANLEARVGREWRGHLEEARAAISALLPVGEGMVEAMEKGADERAYMVTRGYIDGADLEAAFTSAINHILGSAA